MRGSTIKTACGLMAAICLATVLSGCGWTSRDEFLDRHQGAIQPQRGDGSLLAAGEDDAFRAQSGKVTVRATDGQGR